MFEGKTAFRTMAIGAMLALSLCVWSAPARADAVGKITQVTGKAQVTRGGSTMDAAPAMPVELHDQLKTGSPGQISLEMLDNSVLTVNESSVLSIDESLVNAGTRTTTNVGLLSGSLHSVVSAVARTAAPSFTVSTPNAIAGVRGTDFNCQYSSGKARAGFPDCFEFTDCATTSGMVLVTNNPPKPNVGVEVGAGQRTTVPCLAAPLAATTGTLGALGAGGSTLGAATVVGAGLAAGGVIAGTTVGVIEATGGGSNAAGVTVSPSR
jgi:hypothetical protein